MNRVANHGANEDLRYPVGQWTWPSEVTAEDCARWIRDIEALPAKLREAVAGLAPEHLDIPYREGGWTIRQIVHHVPESHMNSYIRFKLALTEDNPTVKPYDEALWAKLPDASTAPIDLSLDLADALHKRWGLVLRAMTDGDFARTYYHPESGTQKLDAILGLYAWHGRHHVGQIVAIRGRNGW
jgi:uncharacterized damage-inducible protein DinB